MQTYRFSGLIAVLGLVALLIGMSVMLAFPDIQFAAWGILLLGVLLIAAAFIIDYRRVGQALTGRRGRFGVGATVMASIFIGITMVVNAISIGNYHRFDLTGVSQFTLTSQTKEVLLDVDTPVNVLCFFTPVDPYGGLNSYLTNLLSEYQNYTDKLSVEFIDPDEHPDQARQYGIQIYSTVVFESGNHRRQVLPQEILLTDSSGQQIVGVEAEHAFTSAILEVTGIIQKKVYFLTGHGESNIDSTTSSGYSSAGDGLRDNLYKIATLNLLTTPSIPEDATALIIAGPQKSLSSSEVKILENYLENDGWLMILTNPESSPEIEQLLSPWGIEIEDGTVIDPSSYVDPSKDIPLVTWQRNFLVLPEIYFPGATAIIPQSGYTPTPLTSEAGMLNIVWTSENSQIVLYSLVRTSQDSWLERDFDPLEEPKFNDGIDLEGPLNIGFLITPITTAEFEDVKGPRLLVFGDSDFASNQHFYNGNNGELFLTSVNQLTLGTELISIERKVLPFRRLIVGPLEARFINYSSVALLPVVILLVGGIIWWRRR